MNDCPSDPGRRLRSIRWRGRFAPLLAVLLIGVPLALLPLLVPASAAESPNYAGLVVQHGDGRVLYLLVQFVEPEITGTELLERSGLPLDGTAYGPLGLAVCRLDGEGCPVDNCFCESYGNPAWYWRYHRLGPDGAWVPLQIGPNSRRIGNGDVDGWSWSTTGNDLPPTSLAEIARLNGVDVPGTETVGGSGGTPAPGDAATPDTEPASANSTTDPSVQASVEQTPTDTMPSRGVVVDPTAGITPIDLETDSSGPPAGYLAFAGFLLGICALLGWAVFSRRRGSR